VKHLLALGLAVLTGCPDTELPERARGQATRVCSASEVYEFYSVSQQEIRPDLWVAFVDVGQGDATFIRTPGTAGLDARDILVDAGDCRTDKAFGNDPDLSECGIRRNDLSGGQVDGVEALITFLTRAGLPPGSTLDYLVVTHPDKDHYGGGWRILQEYQVGAVLDPGIEAEGVTYQALRRAVQAEGATELRPALVSGLEGTGERSTFTWGADTRVELMAADANAPEENNGSVVLMFEFARRKVLLTGDAEAELDAALVAEHGTRLQADVLKAGHHAGVGTNTQPLLDAVDPTYVVVSAGRRDGLPNLDTIDRLLAQVGAEGLFRTDRGDELKDRDTAPGDDHLLLRITPAGELSLCYLRPD